MVLLDLLFYSGPQFSSPLMTVVFLLLFSRSNLTFFWILRICRHRCACGLIDRIGYLFVFNCHSFVIMFSGLRRRLCCLGVLRVSFFSI